MVSVSLIWFPEPLWAGFPGPPAEPGNLRGLVPPRLGLSLSVQAGGLGNE